ncbi:MAG: PilZ domain-containing protein [Nitrospirae bacterium]|nr:PilZ domain-containing protein [Nitrospirota bacterium]
MEKRSKDRIGKRLIVKFGTVKPDRLGFTEDLSPTGLFIKTGIVSPPGTALRIELTLPDDRTILMAGVVMWAKQVPHSLLRFTKKNGMGLRLTQSGDDYKRFLAEIDGGIKGTGS